jgi:RNA polymerase sigma factor (sigma-70 family)
MNREQLILEKMQLVSTAVQSYLRRNPTMRHLRNDLHSGGTIGLLKGIDRLAPKMPDDAYLMTCIQGSFPEAVSHEQTIRIPCRTHDARKKLGKPIEPIYCGPLSDRIEDPNSSNLLNEVLECCRDDRERNAIRLKAAGCSQAEIASELGVTQARVSQIIGEIERRFFNDDHEHGSDEPYVKPIRKRGSSTTCACGEPVKFSNEDRCCNCWALDQQRYHGRSQRIKTAA